MVEVMKIMSTSFRRSHAGTAALRAPNLQQASAYLRLHQRLLYTHGQVWVSGGLLRVGGIECSSAYMEPFEVIIFITSTIVWPQVKQ